MVKLTGKTKIKTAVFISGRGSNLKSLIKFANLKKSPIQIKLILSTNNRAKGLSFARKHNIKYKTFKFEDKTRDEMNVLKYLNKNEISLICLAGFMKILSINFIKKFNGKILNIHPSLLPSYKGLNTHQRVIKSKEKFSGCTVHFVNSRLDAGKIIMQKKIKVKKNDTAKSLASRILKQEHVLYPKALGKLFFNR